MYKYMRNIFYSLTHMAVYKKVARKLVPFLTTIMLLANSYLPYFAYGIQPTIAHADAPPALAVTFDKSTNELELAVNTASKVYPRIRHRIPSRRSAGIWR